MSAIYKKELKSYYTSMIGYIVAALTLVAVGIYFYAYNLLSLSPFIGYALSGASITLLIVVPILTMRSLAEEQRSKTDQLLLTAPVSIGKIVMGKFLAMVSVILFPVVIICFYPLALALFGKVPFLSSYSVIFGFLLLYAAAIAVGMFISSITESQIIAAVVSFGVLFLSFLMGGISGMVSDTAKTSLIAFTVLIIALVFMIYGMTKNVVVPVVVGLAGEGVLIAVYVLKSAWLAGAINKVLNSLDIMSRFNTFVNGTLDLGAVLYYLSVIGLFCFLTYQSIEKRRWS
ncbi:ABC transporter permease [Diplocloster modestus]|uniref:ABC transporter permease n=1 Tax=Diplocloster modestus TaxID=2850322 RepID=A0ABS6K7F4_9FIRM|nr:ABC transporter permease [Diplocloster modestus]MBU9726466.1 ABC transporter permease [Diplocloster modestus]